MEFKKIKRHVHYLNLEKRRRILQCHRHTLLPSSVQMFIRDTSTHTQFTNSMASGVSLSTRFITNGIDLFPHILRSILYTMCLKNLNSDKRHVVSPKYTCRSRFFKARHCLRTLPLAHAFVLHPYSTKHGQKRRRKSGVARVSKFMLRAIQVPYIKHTKYI